MNLPMISVVMPVYNAEKYLKESIDSILNQTYTDFEFIILNDGSTDNTEKIILSYDDQRIVYVKNEENLQIVKTLNKGIAISKGKYIARMDADDISLPERFEKQIKFMESNVDISVCGSFLETIGKEEKRIWKYPITPESIKVTLMFNSPLAHPSVIIRKSFFDKAVYSLEYQKAEDYYLWVENSNESKYANIPEVLLYYRLHEFQTGQVSYDMQLKLSNDIRKKFLKTFGMEMSIEEYDIHEKISRGLYVDMYKAELWLHKLYLQNESNKLFDEEALKTYLDAKWWLIVNNSTFLGIKTFLNHPKSKLNFYPKSIIKNTKFLIKCLIRYKMKVNKSA